MIEFEEYKSKLNDLKPKLEELRAAFVPQSLLDELERLHAMAEAPGFWDDPARSQKAVMRTKTLERKRDKFQSMCSEWDDLMTICEMALEENDDSMLEELTAGYAKLEADMEEARLETLLTGEYDANNALLSFHAGAGGTDFSSFSCSCVGRTGFLKTCCHSSSNALSFSPSFSFGFVSTSLIFIAGTSASIQAYICSTCWKRLMQVRHSSYSFL